MSNKTNPKPKFKSNIIKKDGEEYVLIKKEEYEKLLKIIESLLRLYGAIE